MIFLLRKLHVCFLSTSSNVLMITAFKKLFQIISVWGDKSAKCLPVCLRDILLQ